MIKTARLKKFQRTWKHHPQRDVPMYNLSKSSVSEEELNEFFDWCLHWCQKKFGKVKGKSVPTIEWVWNDRWYQEKNFLAFYDKEDNQIDLRIQGHRNIYNLANTIVHEYIHYLQPTHGNWYERYDKKHGYNNNPYEIEAYHLGETYSVECARTVLQWMKKGGKKR
jgi:hypothetical protein